MVAVHQGQRGQGVLVLKIVALLTTHVERIKEIVKLIMIVKVILSVQTVMKTFALREKIGIALITAAGVRNPLQEVKILYTNQVNLVKHSQGKLVLRLVV